jgi:hypothetical protein
MGKSSIVCVFFPIAMFDYRRVCPITNPTWGWSSGFITLTILVTNLIGLHPDLIVQIPFDIH